MGCRPQGASVQLQKPDRPLPTGPSHSEQPSSRHGGVSLCVAPVTPAFRTKSISMAVREKESNLAREAILSPTPWVSWGPRACVQSRIHPLVGSTCRITAPGKCAVASNDAQEGGEQVPTET